MEHLPTPPGLATGDNVDLALQVGAALDRTDTSWNWPSSQIPGKAYEGRTIGDLMLGERMLPHRNKHGERFCNEAAHNVAFAFEERDALGSLVNVPAWAILDSQYRAKYPLMFKYMPGSRDPAWLIKAGTLGELAGKIGVDAERLRQTISRFNANVQAGRDLDFGRGQSGYERALGDRRAMHSNLGAVDTSPYYALPVYSSAVGTRGGAKTDEHGRVLRSDGTVIVGLCGAGNAVAGFFGRNIMAGGVTIMSAMTFARRAILHTLRAERGSAI